jgi:hypothetical protein
MRVVAGDLGGPLIEHESRRRRLRGKELLSDRDELLWDFRWGVRSRAGFRPMPAAEVAVYFHIHRVYVHQILARLDRQKRRPKGQRQRA